MGAMLYVVVRIGGRQLEKTYFGKNNSLKNLFKFAFLL